VGSAYLAIIRVNRADNKTSPFPEVGTSTSLTSEPSLQRNLTWFCVCVAGLLLGGGGNAFDVGAEGSGEL